MNGEMVRENASSAGTAIHDSITGHWLSPSNARFLIVFDVQITVSSNYLKFSKMSFRSPSFVI